MGRGSCSHEHGTVTARARVRVVRPRPVLYANRDNPAVAAQRQVAFDLDSTIYPLTVAMRALPGGEGVDIHRCVTWGTLVEQCGGLERALKLFDAAMSYEHMSRFAPFDGVADGLKAVQEHGVAVHVMTSRDPKHADGTLRWLHDHGIRPVTFTCDLSTDKVQKCRELGIETIADDHPELLKKAHASGLEALTLTWPYNREVVSSLGLRGASDWHDLADGVLDAVERRVLRALNARPAAA